MEWMRVAVLLAGGLVGQDGAVVPAGADGPGVVALSQDSTVDQVLDALDKRGQGLKDFTAGVTLEEKGDLETTVRKGRVVYQRTADGDARMRVVFDSKRRGKKVTDQKMEYLLEKGWLTERDYDRKSEIRRQVARPGEKIDLLKLGEGPFPLPVGQPRGKVLEMFEVTKEAAKEGDPAGTVHVALKPREGTRFAKKFKVIDVWVEMKTGMPVRIRTTNVDETQERTTDLEMKGINGGLKDGDFALERVGAGWDLRSEKYEE